MVMKRLLIICRINSLGLMGVEISTKIVQDCLQNHITVQQIEIIFCNIIPDSIFLTQFLSRIPNLVLKMFYHIKFFHYRPSDARLAHFRVCQISEM